MKTKKTLVLISALCILVPVLFLLIYFLLPVYHYHVGTRLYDKEQYSDSFSHLIKCRNYKDCESLLDTLEINYTKSTKKEYSEGSVVSTVEYEYNDWGYETLEAEYDSEGKLIHKHKYEYDENADRTLHVSYHSESDKTYTTRFEYEVDEKNELVMMAAYDDKGNITSKTRYEYEYDADGNKIRFTILNLNDKTVYEYDKNGAQTLKAVYDASNNLTFYEAYSRKYDQNGNEIFYASYDKDGNVLQSNEREFDNKGNVIVNIQNGEKEVREYTSEGKLFKRLIYTTDGSLKYKYEYGKNGEDFIETCYNADGEIEKKSEWRYDRHGNITDIIHYNENTNEISSRTESIFNEYGHKVSETTYDQSGNIVLEYINEYEYNELGGIKSMKTYMDGDITAEDVYSEPVVVNKKDRPQPHQAYVSL